MKLQDKIDEILRKASEEAEGANYHDFCGLAEMLFADLKNLIPLDLHLKAAKIIAEDVTAQYNVV